MLSGYLSRNSLTYDLLLKDSFARNINSQLTVFFLQHFNMSSQCLLVSLFLMSYQLLKHQHIESVVHDELLFFLAAFKILSFSLAFNNLMKMLLGVENFEFAVCSWLSFLNVRINVIHQIWGFGVHCLFKQSFCSILSYSPSFISGILSVHMLVCINASYWFSRLLGTIGIGQIKTPQNLLFSWKFHCFS